MLRPPNVSEIRPYTDDELHQFKRKYANAKAEMLAAELHNKTLSEEGIDGPEPNLLDSLFASIRALFRRTPAGSPIWTPPPAPPRPERGPRHAA